ncbi:COG3650 family protein [Brevundimonas sp.]|uniref:COG3650 family protein n=1 Tax=Brevundimonas sp. TaxID=1871086 RepID=UPI003BADBD9C
MRLVSAILPSAILLPVLILAACSEPIEKAAPPPGPKPAAVLGGVDLNQPVRAVGTEPFWGVEISGENMIYTGIDQPDQRASAPDPVIQGTTAVYTAATQGGVVMVVTLIATECSDGMSDRVYPLTAKVEIGKDTRNGCAASEAFLMTAPAP